MWGVRPLDTYRQARLSLEEFVEAVNELLPTIMPPDVADQRLKEELTPRLVRHYATQGGLDMPEREGREARYTYRQLLQVLALRLLQAQGHRTSSVNPLTAGMTDAELEDLLAGGRQVSLTPAPNPALQFLEGLRAKAPTSPATPATQASPSPTPSPTLTPSWTRHDIAPGLELHVRGDFRFPPTTDGQAEIFRRLHEVLKSQGVRRQR